MKKWTTNKTKDYESIAIQTRGANKLLLVQLLQNKERNAWLISQKYNYPATKSSVSKFLTFLHKIELEKYIGDYDAFSQQWHGVFGLQKQNKDINFASESEDTYENAGDKNKNSHSFQKIISLKFKNKLKKTESLQFSIGNYLSYIFLKHFFPKNFQSMHKVFFYLLWHNKVFIASCSYDVTRAQSTPQVPQQQRPQWSFFLPLHANDFMPKTFWTSHQYQKNISKIELWKKRKGTIDLIVYHKTVSLMNKPTHSFVRDYTSQRLLDIKNTILYLNIQNVIPYENVLLRKRTNKKRKIEDIYISSHSYFYRFSIYDLGGAAEAPLWIHLDGSNNDILFQKRKHWMYQLTYKASNLLTTHMGMLVKR